jgi:hypothetical protein
VPYAPEFSKMIAFAAVSVPMRSGLTEKGGKIAPMAECQKGGYLERGNLPGLCPQERGIDDSDSKQKVRPGSRLTRDAEKVIAS